ncbi:MAG: HD domain-containing protein [Lachnospiraceae bacterium]|nr:HD domain-containing protein [Lachnospiraceae bacterium]
MQFINELKDGDELNTIYHVKTKSQATAKTGKEYFNIQFSDRTGTIDGRIWDTSSPAIEEFKAGDFVEVEGDVISYNNQLQLKIRRLRIADKSEFNSEDYFAKSKYDKKDMAKELDSFIEEVENTNFKKLLKSFFVDDKAFRDKFLSHQGAKTVHHSFVSGLVEHTLSTTRLAKAIAKNYDDINVDLVITTALLHDIAKLDEIASYPDNEYTDEGYLIGHIVMAYGTIKNRIEKLGGFSKIEEDELLHCILSHHGSAEFGSPKQPMLMEAYIVSQADNTDAKIEIMRESIANAKITNKMDVNGFVSNKFMTTNFRESKS